MFSKHSSPPLPATGRRSLREEIPSAGFSHSSDSAGCNSPFDFVSWHRDVFRNTIPTAATRQRPVSPLVIDPMARLILKSAVFAEGHVVLSTEDLPVTLGRSHRADITINDLLLSRIHSEIRLNDDGEVELVDRDSTNLTIVNERDIDSVVLKNGDHILLGETELTVEIDPPDSGLQEKTTREITAVQNSKQTRS